MNIWKIRNRWLRAAVTLLTLALLAAACAIGAVVLAVGGAVVGMATGAINGVQVLCDAAGSTWRDTRASVIRALTLKESA